MRLVVTNNDRVTLTVPREGGGQVTVVPGSTQAADVDARGAARIRSFLFRKIRVSCVTDTGVLVNSVKSWEEVFEPPPVEPPEEAPAPPPVKAAPKAPQPPSEPVVEAPVALAPVEPEPAAVTPVEPDPVAAPQESSVSDEEVEAYASENRMRALRTRLIELELSPVAANKNEAARRILEAERARSDN